MNFTDYFLLSFSFLYLLFFIPVLYAWMRPDHRSGQIAGKINGISVVIPFRNEAGNLPALIENLEKQNASDFEIILINDHSEDQGTEIAENAIKSKAAFKLFSLPSGVKGKKQAILFGIDRATFDFIVTTDADCIHSPAWISSIQNELTAGADFCAGIISVTASGNFFSAYQELDMMAVQGVCYGAAASGFPIAVSGANLAFSKSLFYELKPYGDNLHTASGDDIYFLQKAKKSGKLIRYTRNHGSKVLTQPVSFASFIRQRIRWMKKRSSFSDPATIFSGILLSSSAFIFLFCAVYQGIQMNLIPAMVIYMIFKMSIDFLLLFLVALRMGNKKALFFFIPSFVLNLIFTVFFFLAGWFIPVDWKGRRV